MIAVRDAEVVALANSGTAVCRANAEEVVVAANRTGTPIALLIVADTLADAKVSLPIALLSVAMGDDAESNGTPVRRVSEESGEQVARTEEV